MLRERDIKIENYKLSYGEIKKLSNSKSFVFDTPRATKYPLDAGRFIQSCMKDMGIGEKKQIFVLAGAKELVANAIEHGNVYDPTKSVEVVCASRNSMFYFMVIDDGQGFDIKNCRTAYNKDRGTGIVSTRRAVDLLYNFKDSRSIFYAADITKHPFCGACSMASQLSLFAIIKTIYDERLNWKFVFSISPGIQKLFSTKAFFEMSKTEP